LPLLELQDISLSFQDQLVLEDISLSFEEGQCTMIIGNSGCGKSTLLKTIAGIIPPDTGCVLFKGEDIFTMNEKEYQAMQFQTGFMFQDSALWANKSLYDNLSFPILVANPKMNRLELDQIIQKMVQSIGFKNNLMLRPANLSSGERKMLSYLRAIITDPDIVFMDEPTTFIDRKSVGMIKKKIHQLKEQGKTLIGITHEQSFALELADRFIFLKNGKVLADGKPDVLLSSEEEQIKDFVKDLFER